MHELDQFHNFKEKFLGKEGMFSEYKVAIGYFLFHELNEFFGDTADPELKRRGFNFTVYRDMDKFLDEVMNYDIVWVISNKQIVGDKERFVKGMGEFMKAKKSLFLWADNTPFTTHANAILETYFEGMQLEGNYIGQKIITKSDKVEKSMFDQNHSIAYGLNNLYEGVTICHPIKMHPDFKEFARNSNNEPLIIYADENEKHGRIIIDMGTTKLGTNFWGKAGTHQYVSNANVWLTGIPI